MAVTFMQENYIEKAKKKVTFDENSIENKEKIKKNNEKVSKTQKINDPLEENRKKTTKNVNLYHEALGHSTEDTTRLTAKF